MASFSPAMLLPLAEKKKTQGKSNDLMLIMLHKPIAKKLIPGSKSCLLIWQKKFFPNKKDRIIQHFKKCPHFVTKTTAEERAEIFKLLENDNSLTSTIPSKRSCKY